jgi:mono/diheme cytochrome c family protein
MERAGMRKNRRMALAFLWCAALGACRAAGDRPGWVVMPEMYRSVSYKPYDPNPVTGGLTLRLPPDGTVPYGGEAFPYGAGPEEALRAGRELQNPFPPDKANLERGRKVFEAVCIVCHGPAGDGDGPIIGRFPNPPSLRAERARRLPDGQVFHIVARGQGIMPSHAAQVLPEDRWRVVLYLRQLQGPSGSPEPEAPVPGTGGER